MTQLIWQKSPAAGGPSLKWLPPKLDSGKLADEIDRAVTGLSDEGVKIDAAGLTTCLHSGQIAKLTGDTWEAITNTDSLKVETLKDVLEAVRARGKKVRKVLAEFMDGAVTAPILVCYQEHPDRYYLVNGNTRLMIAKVFAIKPKVWLASLPAEGRKKAELGRRIVGFAQRLAGTGPGAYCARCGTTIIREGADAYCPTCRAAGQARENAAVA